MRNSVVEFPWLRTRAISADRERPPNVVRFSLARPRHFGTMLPNSDTDVSGQGLGELRADRVADELARLVNLVCFNSVSLRELSWNHRRFADGNGGSSGIRMTEAALGGSRAAGGDRWSGSVPPHTHVDVSKTRISVSVTVREATFRRVPHAIAPGLAAIRRFFVSGIRSLTTCQFALRGPPVLADHAESLCRRFCRDRVPQSPPL